MTSLAEETNVISSTDPDDCAALVLETVPLVMRTVRAEMRGSRAPDLSVPQFRALNFLYRHPGASLSDVADHVGTTLPSMSKLVEKLVARGLVTRQDDPGDRRRVTLALTQTGQAELQAARQAAQARLAQRLAALSPEQRAVVMEAMRTLREVFSPK